MVIDLTVFNFTEEGINFVIQGLERCLLEPGIALQGLIEPALWYNALGNLTEVIFKRVRIILVPIEETDPMISRPRFCTGRLGLDKTFVFHLWLEGRTGQTRRDT